MTDLSQQPADQKARAANKIRFVTAASLFDGHDASINIMRRILQASGVEVIHLGHNRSVDEVVNAAIQEDVQGIAISSYQGGHVEYFKYVIDLLRERGGEHIKVFGGGGAITLQPATFSNFFTVSGTPGTDNYMLTSIVTPVDTIEFDPFASPWRPPHEPKDVANKGAVKSEPAPAAPTGPGAAETFETGDLRSAVLAHERKILEAALARHRHNQRATAKALNLTYDQLRHCLKRHELLG